MTEIDRRAVLKALATAAPAAAVLSWTPADAAGAAYRARLARRRAAETGQAFQRQFFTEKEWETLRVLVDLILPRDDRSGSATDAGVPEYMDFMLMDQPNQRDPIRGGLAWLDREASRRFGTTFVEATDANRRAILDDIAWPQRATPEMSHGVAFFNRFRDLTAAGFWTSKMGIEDLGYIGNVAVPSWDGCPDEALRRLGLPTGG